MTKVSASGTDSPRGLCAQEGGEALSVRGVRLQDHLLDQAQDPRGQRTQGTDLVTRN